MQPFSVVTSLSGSHTLGDTWRGREGGTWRKLQSVANNLAGDGDCSPEQRGRWPDRVAGGAILLLLLRFLFLPIHSILPFLFLPPFRPPPFLSLSLPFHCSLPACLPPSLSLSLSLPPIRRVTGRFEKGAVGGGEETRNGMLQYEVYLKCK